MKKLVRDQLKVVTGGGCNPSAGIDCPLKYRMLCFRVE